MVMESLVAALHFCIRNAQTPALPIHSAYAFNLMNTDNAFSLGKGSNIGGGGHSIKAPDEKHGATECHFKINTLFPQAGSHL